MRATSSACATTRTRAAPASVRQFFSARGRGCGNSASGRWTARRSRPSRRPWRKPGCESRTERWRTSSSTGCVTNVRPAPFRTGRRTTQPLNRCADSCAFISPQIKHQRKTGRRLSGRRSASFTLSKSSTIHQSSRRSFLRKANWGQPSSSSSTRQRSASTTTWRSRARSST